MDLVVFYFIGIFMFTVSSRKSSLILTSLLLACCSPLCITAAWAMDPPVGENPKHVSVQKKEDHISLMEALEAFEAGDEKGAAVMFAQLQSTGSFIATSYSKHMNKPLPPSFALLPDKFIGISQSFLKASLAYREYRTEENKGNKANKGKMLKKLDELGKMLLSGNTHALTLFKKLYQDPTIINSLKNNMGWLKKVRREDDFRENFPLKKEKACEFWDCYDVDSLRVASDHTNPLLKTAFQEFEERYKAREPLGSIALALSRQYPAQTIWILLALGNGINEGCVTYAQNFLATLPSLSQSGLHEACMTYLALSRYCLSHVQKGNDNSLESATLCQSHAQVYKHGLYGEKKDKNKEISYLKEGLLHLENYTGSNNKELQSRYARIHCLLENWEESLKYYQIIANEKQPALADEEIPENMDELFENCKKKAERGDSEMQFAYAFMLEDGKVTPRNLEEAKKYYELAANQGHLRAQNNLADMYYHGRGCEKNLGKALEWWKKAAEKRDPDAQHNYGRFLEFEKGAAPNLKEALRYYELAEEQDHGAALSHFSSLLARMHFQEPGLVSIDKALFYNEKCALSRFADAQHNCSVLYEAKGGAENLQKALHHRKRAADQGLPIAQYYYSCLLSKETEFQDLKEARRYLQLAAAQGHTDALIRLNELDRPLKQQPIPEIDEQNEELVLELPSFKESIDSSDEEQESSTSVLPEAQESAQAEAIEINVNVAPQIHPDIPQIKPDVPQIPLPKKPKKILPQEDSKSEDLTQSQELVRELASCAEENSKKIQELRVKKKKAKAYQVLRLKRKDYEKTCTSFPTKLTEPGEKKKLVVSNKTMEFVIALFGQGIKINTFSNDEAKKAFGELGCTIARKKGENSTILTYNLGSDREMELHYEEQEEDEIAPQTTTEQKTKYHNPHGHGDNKMYNALKPHLKRFLESIGITPERLEVK